MFDTMTFTKILGGFSGAFLIFLLGKWAAETIYHTGGGYGNEEYASGYAIEVGDDAEAGDAGEEGPSFDELLASAEPEKGERVFGKCRACHALEDGANATGPHLYDVVGRDVGSVSGYGYSGALSEAADVWTPENLNAFLENPRGYAPGTTMGFSGLSKVADRANLIAYLDTIGE